MPLVCPPQRRASGSAYFTYFRLLNFRDSYYARRGLLDHLNSDGFDCWSDWLFHPPRSFLHWCALGLGVGLALATVFACAALRALGPDPRGWIVYTPERVMVFVLKGDRKKPVGLVPTPEEKLALYDTMFAYSGTYTVKSDRVIHHLDMSWNEVCTVRFGWATKIDK